MKTELTKIGDFIYEVKGNTWRQLNGPSKEQMANALIYEIEKFKNECDKNSVNYDMNMNGIHAISYLGKLLELYNFNICLMVMVLENWHKEHIKELNKVKK